MATRTLSAAAAVLAATITINSTNDNLVLIGRVYLICPAADYTARHPLSLYAA
jgi:hypothetical protein